MIGKIEIDDLGKVIYTVAFFLSVYMIFYTLDPLWFIGWCLLDMAIVFHLYFLQIQKRDENI